MFYGIRNTIINNNFSKNCNEGLLLSSSRNNLVSENYCTHNDIDNTKTYDGIRFTNNSDNNEISGNHCQNNNAYEIRILDTDCNDNRILGNVCRAEDHVGTIYDAGTGTVILDNIE